MGKTAANFRWLVVYVCEIKERCYFVKEKTLSFFSQIKLSNNCFGIQAAINQP